MANFYIYNFDQARYFINRGLPLLEIGRGSRGDVYFSFARDDLAENVFMDWKRLKYGNHAR